MVLCHYSSGSCPYSPAYAFFAATLGLVGAVIGVGASVIEYPEPIRQYQLNKEIRHLKRLLNDEDQALL